LLRRLRRQLLKTIRIPPEQQLSPTPVVTLTAVLVLVPSVSLSASLAVAVFSGGDRFLVAAAATLGVVAVTVVVDAICGDHHHQRHYLVSGI